MSADLKSRLFLIIDCQTTGMRPSVGDLLEFAWGYGRGDEEPFEIHSRLVRLPPGESIPARVSEITGIKMNDLSEAIDFENLRTEFVDSLKTVIDESGLQPIALIHYAQFEEAWLKHLLGEENLIDGKLPFEIFCTHKIAKRLFPTVPSRTIRGLSGFFGKRIGDIKRAHQHVLATQKIWQGLVSALQERGIESVEALREFMAQKTTSKSKSQAATSSKVKSPSYEYRVEREKRLALSPKPGIYKMIAKNGEILYVGKATSLRDRVNSYFRGRKGRDTRKLELMAQVWDVETVECGSAIEAALLESDEIKRLNPPYNVSLKEGARSLIYYNRDFSDSSPVQTVDFPVGPFRTFSGIENLRQFIAGLKRGGATNVFYQPIERAILDSGYELFKEKYPRFHGEQASVRDHLAFAIKLLRATSIEVEQISEADADDIDDETDENRDEDITPEEMLDKIERLYLHAAQTYLRTREMTGLLWADVEWTEKGETKNLKIRGGQLRSDEQESAPTGLNGCPWSQLTIRDYDRMSVLLTEISKFDHEIRTLTPSI